MKLVNSFLILSLVFISSSLANEFPIDPTVKYGKLDNGLTYYIRKNNTPKNKVYLKLVIKAGSLMEEDHQQGLAHLLEHMAFNGSKNFPKNEIDNFLSSIGLNLGSHFNATTGFFLTNYEFEIPLDNEENLEKGIQILSDIAGNLDLKDGQFEKERKIVEEEWRQNLGEDNNYVTQLLNYLHKGSLLLYRKPVGKIEIIQNFKYQDVIDYYEKWYQPQVMGIFAVGSVNEDKTEQLIRQYFSYLENKSDLISPDPTVPDFDKNQFFFYQNEKEQNVALTLWEKNKFKPVNNFANYRLTKVKDIVENIFDKRISKLTNENKVDFKYAYISTYNISNEDEYFIVNADLKSDKINEGIADFYSIIEQIKKYGFLQAELDKSKEEIIERLKQFKLAEETRSSYSFVREYTRHFTEDEMISGPEKYLEYTKDILPTITLEDINSYFNNYIKNENQVLEVRGPEIVGNLPNQEQINEIKYQVSLKNIEPYEYEIKKVELIKEELKGSKIIKTRFYPNSDIKKITLENGAKVYLKKTDFKKDQIIFKAFSPGGYSTASLHILPSAEYADSILSSADIGELTVPEKNELYPTNMLGIYPEIYELSENISGYTNNAYKEDFFKLMYLNFTDLRVKQHHVDNFKDRNIDELKIEKESPKYEFLVEFYNKFYNNNERTAYPTIRNYEKINLKDVQEFYKDRFQNSGDFIFAIVGDFRFEEIEPLILKYIGSLKFKNHKDNFKDQNIRINLSRENVKYEEENPVKASVARYYNKKFKYTFSERLKNRILISIINKLMFDEIREKNKLVYSSYAYEFFSQKYPRELISISIGYGSDPINIDKIDKEIDKIFDNVKNKKFDRQIFVNQKKVLINDLKNQQNTNKYWMDSIIRADKYNENFERYAYIEQIIN
ncbi:insulinase family protein, partial [Candidatus Pelagibacter sp.]|nr:insulinase family protein [Candidatus Pelagibacter sp.]